MKEEIRETSEGVIFSNIDSPEECKQLYTNTVQKTGAWSAVLLSSTSTYDKESITLLEASTQNSYYLFANSAPTDPIVFISKIRAELGDGNLTLAWITDIDSTFDASNVIKMELTPKFSEIAVLQPFTCTVGNDFAQLSIANNTIISFVPEEAPTQMQFAYTNRPSNFTFTSVEVGTDSLFDHDIFLPFSTESSGAFKFKLGLNSDTYFEAFNLQNTFYYHLPEEDDIQCNIYPILKESGDDDLFIMSQTAIDLLDVTNAKGENTYFALTGESFHVKTTQNSPTNISSYYSTNLGHPINLLPRINWKEELDPNNLIPSELSPRFVIRPQDADDELRDFLQIDGYFYLEPTGGDADENGNFDLLPGLSGSETISFSPYSIENKTGDLIAFKSAQPAYASNFPSTALSLTNPGEDKPTLCGSYLTSWANVIAGTGVSEPVQYSAQATGAALFAKDHGVTNKISGKPNLLGFYEPSIDMPSDIYVPMAPFLGVETLTDDPKDKQYSKFESEVLSKERKEQITAKKPTARASKSLIKRNMMLKSGGSTFTPSTTPQGLIAHVNNTGSWGLLNLAQNNLEDAPSKEEYLFPEGQVPANPSQYQASFINLTDTLQQGFMTNQQFLVSTQDNHLGKLFSQYVKKEGDSRETSEAYFNNKMSIEDWPFDMNVGQSNTYSDYNNVLIFKFCKGTLKDWAKDPKTWTQANTFNTEGVSDSQEKYQQLVAISSWIQNYITEAEAAYAYGLDNPESNQAILYEKFVNTANDPNWNGILALKVDIDLQDFPQQLKGLISGIDLTNFFGHHLGIEVNKVTADGGIEMEKNSSLFGLINYLDPAYTSQIAQGLNTDAPIVPTPGVTYEFKVLQLQVLFENTAIKFFQSKVQLTMNNLFSDKVIGTNNPYATSGNNSVVLNGTYQDHDGTPVYIFENTDDNLYYFNSNLLKNVEITKIQFNTLTTDPNATKIESRFAMWGYLNFAVMSKFEKSEATTDDPIQPTGTYSYFDAFSFGNNDGDNNTDIQKGLNYNNLFIDMSFELSIPTVVTYGFDSGQIVFNSNSSISRPASLYPNFALQVNNLVSGNSDTLPSSLGYLNLSIPQIQLSGLGEDWYGLEMTLNMGTPGELAASLDFNASLLLAWSPGAKSSDTSYDVFIGIKLPGTSSDAKLLSLQGVLKLSIDTLKLEFLPDTNPKEGSFMMTLGNIVLKFLGIVQLPPGGTTNFLLFGNPDKAATSKSLGWYASYNKTQ